MISFTYQASLEKSNVQEGGLAAVSIGEVTVTTIKGQPQSLPLTGTQSRPLPVLFVAWVVTLLVSILPNILWTELTGATPAWVFWAKIALLLFAAALTIVRPAIKPLRAYFVIFLTLLLAEALFFRVGNIAQWQEWFGGAGVSFSREMLGVQLLRLAVTAVMIAMLFVIKRRRSEFFLVKGELDAPAAPVRWLIDKPVGWVRLGWMLTLCITLGTLLFLVLAGKPSSTMLKSVLPLLPAVMVLAAINAFNESVNYRAALLAPLHTAVGGAQAMLVAAAFFGIGHFYGVPYGPIGVVMAFVLGWFLNKSMLETKGFFWPWFIHFWQDVAIFSFMAIGSVNPGG